MSDEGASFVLGTLIKFILPSASAVSLVSTRFSLRLFISAYPQCPSTEMSPPTLGHLLELSNFLNQFTALRPLRIFFDPHMSCCQGVFDEPHGPC